VAFPLSDTVFANSSLGNRCSSRYRCCRTAFPTGAEKTASWIFSLYWFLPITYLLDFVESYYWIIIAAFLIAYLLYLINALDLLICYVIGLIPAARNTIAWANASWFIQDTTKTVPIFSVQQMQLKRLANDVIDTLVNSPRSDYLALRPQTLMPEAAGNVLLFGHVIEEYCSSVKRKSFKWAKFYDALSKAAVSSKSAFLPAEILKHNDSNHLFSAILGCNTSLPVEEQIPNDTGLEEAVRSAFVVLRNKWRGDATTLNRGLFGTDYSRVLANAKTILRQTEMQRQFAKLYILWSIKPDATKPDVFEVPFSRSMLVRFIDEGAVNVSSDRLLINDERLYIVFSCLDKKLIQTTRSLIEGTRDGIWSKWRQQERMDISSRNIDWSWWINYRIDTQLYAESRGHTSKSWKILDNQIEKSKN
jgi:hypothetical protein